MRILSPYLKRIEFLGFERDKWKLDIAQLMLEHENALEKMFSVGLMKPTIMKSQW